MKKFLLATVALAALAPRRPLAPTSAHGPYNKAPAYAAPLYNWTGFYLGGHLGGAFSGSNNFNGLVLSDYSARLMGGFQAGADWQFAPELGCRRRRPVLLARQEQPQCGLPERDGVQQRPARDRLDHRAASATPGVRASPMSKAATPIPTTATP